MGAMRNLKLQIGLLAADVALAKATNERNSITFNRIHKHKVDANGNLVPCLSATGQKIYCKACNVEVTNQDDLGKGYEHAKGQFIEVTDAELDAIKTETNGALIVTEIVTKDEFQQRPYMMSGSVYYLTPPAKDKYPPQTYAMIYEAMKQDQGVAIAKTAMYGRTQAMAIVAGDSGCLLMYMLRYPDEVRPQPLLQLPPIDQKQLPLVRQILDLMKTPSMDLSYRDDYEDGKKTVIENKLKGIVPVVATPAPPVVQNNAIEDQLKATIEMMKAAKANKVAQPAVTAPAVEAEKPAKKSRKSKVA